MLISTGAILFALGRDRGIHRGRGEHGARQAALPRHARIPGRDHLVATGDAEGPLVTWVLGSSGLLGGAVLREHERRGFPVVNSRIPWRDHAAAVDALLEVAGRLPEDGWRSPGVPAPGWSGRDRRSWTPRCVSSRSSSADGSPARRTVRARSSSRRRQVASTPGSTDPPFTEQHDTATLAPYGHAKLRIEQLFAEHARRLGRGAARRAHREPLRAGAGPRASNRASSPCCATPWSPASSSRSTSRSTPCVTTSTSTTPPRWSATASTPCRRPVARTPRCWPTGSPMSISEILGHLTRLSRRRPPVVLGPSPVARFQSRDLRLRSRAWPHLDHLVRTPVGVGMANCLSEVRTALRTAE